MTDGYVYCFSNQSMPGILKVGMTERTPEIRLNEANSSDTWRPPTPYIIEFAKKVLNPKHKETTLHNLLSQYTEQINPKREFFRVSSEEVKTFFDLIDGDFWVKDPEEEKEEESDEDNQSIISNSPVVKCRDMSKCFTNGQRIRHTIGINKTWIGIYDSSKNGIMYDTKFYKSLSGFAVMHYSIDRTDRVKTANGWTECECEVNEKWISTYNL
jgi:hypothetical protein